jgi:hypothetical protein
LKIRVSVVQIRLRAPYISSSKLKLSFFQPRALCLITFPRAYIPYYHFYFILALDEAQKTESKPMTRARLPFVIVYLGGLSGVIIVMHSFQLMIKR